MNTNPIQQEDEIAIRQLVQDMQDDQNTKNGKLFASAFAEEHDYIAIERMFLPNQTRQDNAHIHQRLYEENTSSVAGRYGEVEVRLERFQDPPPYPGGRRGARSERVAPEERSRQEDQEHHNRPDAQAGG
jgi:hypothetical protein